MHEPSGPNRAVVHEIDQTKPVPAIPGRRDEAAAMILRPCLIPSIRIPGIIVDVVDRIGSPPHVHMAIATSASAHCPQSEIRRQDHDHENNETALRTITSALTNQLRTLRARVS